MNILILNGSPAGDDSITLQTMLYIEKHFPDHEYVQLNVGRQIRVFEKDFAEAEQALQAADLILFCYPVYTFLAPAQLHRFIELIKEHGVDLRGKYATQLTTSKHFYDTTAHAFIEDNCADLGLKVLRGLSADMEDLLHKKGQKEALAFFKRTLWAMSQGITDTLPGRQAGAALSQGTLSYAELTAGKTSSEKTIPYPARDGAPVFTAASLPAKTRNKKPEGRIAVVADLSEDDAALKAMIDRFRAVSAYHVELVNLRDFPFAGGCLGCFHCASNGTCVYKDGFDSLLREKIQTAEATVYAFSIKDHSMGYRFKLFDDRQFCNGHRTVTMGKPVGYLVSGALSAEPNLTTLIEARAQVGGNHLAGIAGNEGDTDRRVDQLAAQLAYDIRSGYRQPANFYGVGGLKIFRDLIYQMQGLMREDHRFYKKHGFYDFPQKNKGRVAGMYLVG
ncbi:MAG: NAD(P)H-dependent oxidoreductase, partial [Lachnospiraceae bacterium]|nr:NAD(P)H-dependent oxidoreductase [Lachnospiraceae bacterium]